MVSPPNHYAPLKNGRWELISANPTTLWFQLVISDSLGERRYIPNVSSSVELTFMRADSVTSNINFPYQLSVNSQNVVKTAIKNGSDSSLYSVVLTSADVSSIVSGSILVKLTEASVANSFMQNWAVIRKLTGPSM